MSPSSPIQLADVFRFLAQSMRYPEDSWFNDDYLSVFFSLLEQLGWNDDACLVRDHFALSSDRLESLQIEHTRLFINAIPHVVAPPYGSVYLSSDGALYGSSAEKTRDFYREHGFDLASDNEIPDHLVCELEFLALLNKDNLDRDDVFLKTLFRPWFEKFEQRVLNEVQHPFYRVVVNLIDFFTKEEL